MLARTWSLSPTAACMRPPPYPRPLAACPHSALPALQDTLAMYPDWKEASIHREAAPVRPSPGHRDHLAASWPAMPSGRMSETMSMGPPMLTDQQVIGEPAEIGAADQERSP